MLRTMETPEYKRWLVGLDFTTMDTPLIRYVADLARLLEPTDIYFIHIEPDFEKPHYYPEELSSALQAIDEGQEAAMRNAIDSYFDYVGCRVTVQSVEGKPFETLIKWTNVKKIDLLIAGRKSNTEGHAILPFRLSRNSSCSVLFVPEDSKGIQNILVPVDFSEHSAIAIKTAAMLSVNHPNLDIQCLHIYAVPTGYSKSGKSFDEFAEIMRLNAEKEYERFKQKIGIDFPCTFQLKQETAAATIHQVATEHQSGMIILGSKGQTGPSVLLLGSVTEKLLAKHSNILTWVVKKRGENIGLLAAMGLV
jgi:nucleotide-binding universal stress UspA family protein